MTKTPLVTLRGWMVVCATVASLVCAPLAATGAAAQTILPPPGDVAAADSQQNRIEALESQLRDATAENERLQFQLLQAQREIARLQQVTGDLAAANQSLQTPSAPASGAASSPPPGGRAPAPPPAPAQRSSLGDAPPAALPADAGTAYSAARQLLVNGQVAEAEAAFAEFLRVHSDAETAPDARYWYAFTLLARNNYQSAASGFVDYLQRYPSGPRAPEAQVRLGMALAGMSQTRQACAAFRDMPTRYPRASQAVRDLAMRESRAAHCTA